MDIFKELNLEQKAAIIHTGGPLLIVAGAGSGKTAVITKRIAWLIEEKLAKTSEVLALTFTEKASGEMEERLDRLLPYGYLDLWVHTFHSFGQRILELYGLEIGLPNSFKVLDQTQQWILMYNHLDRFHLDYYRPLGNPTKFLHALMRHFSRLKDEAISPSDYLTYAQDVRLNSDSAHFVSQILSEEEQKALTKKEIKELALQEMKKIHELAEAYHVYQQLLLENNALDFGDLIHYCLKLFKERPKILAKFRAQFLYILVDEFQDTNWAQYELIKILAYPKNNLTVVADDDQAIFKFRGASVSNILQFKKDYPEAHQVFLIKNYRSKQNILDLAYRFIQNNNPNRLEVTLSSEKKFSKKLISQKEGDALIEYYELETQEDEMKEVIAKIFELKKSNTDISWSDFAILVRANSMADIFIYGLTQARIPYQYVASKGLYNKPIILDIVSWLKLLDNYHESPSLFRVLSFPIFGFSHREVMNLNYWARRKGKSLYFILSHIQTIEGIDDTSVKKAQTVLHLIEKQTYLMGKKSVKEIVLAFLEESGYLKNITKVESQAALDSLGYLNQFYKKISEFERNSSDPSLRRFLQALELETEAGEEGALAPQPELEGPDSVKVMTIHAAKGLEFGYVFVVNMVDLRFPTIERREPIEIPDVLVKEILPQGNIHLEEERRLLYVACTRAKDGLFFMGAKDYGLTRKKKPSIFIKELGFKKSATPAFFSSYSAVEVNTTKGIKEKYSLPSRFSFSQLKAFETCPWQYRYAFILRVPVKGKSVFSFGKSIHLVMQKFFERIRSQQETVQADLFAKPEVSPGPKSVKEYISLEEALKLYNECFIDDWYKDDAERNSYYEKGKKIIRNYYQDIENEIIRPISLERSFSFKVSDNERGVEYSIFGVIDRVDEKDGALEIVDYKTGEAKHDLKADDKEQLLIYQLAAKKLFEKPVKSLTFHYLDENIKKTFLGEEDDLKKLKEKILSAVHEIEKGEFTPKPGRVCKYCDFRDICEYRAL